MKIICPICETAVEDSNEFCPVCGFPIKKWLEKQNEKMEKKNKDE